jgi:hypothetical protein
MPFTVKRLRMDVGMKKKKNPAWSHWLVLF